MTRTSRRTTFRPRVEPLEDRTVPSLLPGNEIAVDQLSSPPKYGDIAASVATAPGGQFVVAYTLLAPDGSPNNVYAKVFHADGTVAANDFQVNPAGIGAGFASVAVDTAGDFVVVWNAGNAAIEAQLYNASASPVGSTIVVDQVANRAEYSPSVAMDAAGDFVVTWAYGPPGTSASAQARVYSAAGVPLTSAFTVGTDGYTPFGVPVTPHVAMDAAGDFAVAWENTSASSNTETFEVDVQHYNLAGAAQGNLIQVATFTAGTPNTLQLDSPAIAMDQTGNFVVSWESFAQAGLFAQRFDNTGTAQGSLINVNQYGAAYQAYITAAMNASGAFVISWTSVTPGQFPPNDPATDTESEDESSLGVFARGFDASGNDLTGEFQVNQRTFDAQATSSAAIDSSGHLIFAWQSRNQGPNAWNIFSRQYIEETAGYSIGTNQFGRYLNVTAPTDQVTAFAYNQAAAIGAYGFHANHLLSVNGVTQTYPDAIQLPINVQGVGGTALLYTNDTYLGTDQLMHSTAEQVVLGRGNDGIAALGTGEAPLQISGIFNAYAFLDSSDIGDLTPANGMQNTLVTAGSYSYLTSGDSFNYIHGAGYVASYAMNTTDVVYHYDGSGPSTLVVSGPDQMTGSYSFMYGTDGGVPFSNRAFGYRTVHGIAQHAGDTAYIDDSVLSDVFVGFTAYAYMYADNPDGTFAYFNSASGFDQVYAYSLMGGTDYAYNYDPQHNHTSGFIVLT
jgi:hypothetical protein